MKGGKEILNQNGRQDNGSDLQVKDRKPSYRINPEKLRSLVEDLIERRGGKIYDKSSGSWAWTLCPFRSDTHPS